MSIWKFLTDLVEAENHQSKQLALIREQATDLHRENMREARAIRKELEDLRFIVGEIRVAMPLLREIHSAVVPEPVSQIQLQDETGETHMDGQVGQKSTLTFTAKGTSGNPTIPVGGPSWQATNTTDFNLVVAPDGQSAELTIVNPSATVDVTVVVDGVTSNPFTATSGAVTPPPPEPVSSVELVGTPFA